MQPAPLARAGVPILHDCGSLDPWLKDLGGKITVLVTEGEGHFPASRRDPGTDPLRRPSALISQTCHLTIPRP